MAKKKQPEPADPTVPAIRDRIVDFRRVKAGMLIPNEKNWRKHGEKQRAAMAGILREVGYVDALMVRETDAGYVLLDGHLRAETTPDQEVPVLVVDLTQAEADLVLATFDPIAALAETGAAELDALIREIDTGDEALAELVAGMAEDAGIVPPDAKYAPEDFKKVDENIEVEHTCPHCGFQWSGGK
ncbi:MAG: hypothetical protein A3E01_02790 [Gammaproteobacteria bacterium RIFCSPHIGHO2_12_FULL_63_22]|nr:MAG: hypothetical protein A3E01_02790 [Gammaproteobacteria bacterium RIFCSPHIGHO2_12_FULL_63_22]